MKPNHYVEHCAQSLQKTVSLPLFCCHDCYDRLIFAFSTSAVGEKVPNSIDRREG